MSVLVKVGLFTLVGLVLAILVNAQKSMPCGGQEVGMPVRDKCVTHCPGPCGSGTCNATNHCVCNPGFVQSANALICTPPCLRGCMTAMGFCDGVNQCTCPDATKVFDPNTKMCVARPTPDPCNSMCTKGKCQTDGTCLCGTGYQNIGGVPTAECEPICTVVVPNSACVLPDLPGCLTGFTWDGMACIPTPA